jgi:hypothetical protein
MIANQKPQKHNYKPQGIRKLDVKYKNTKPNRQTTQGRMVLFAKPVHSPTDKEQGRWEK